MNKIFALLIVFIVILNACATQEPSCPKNYLLVLNECCLDRDSNSICDRDEIVETTTPKPEILPESQAERVDESPPEPVAPKETTTKPTEETYTVTRVIDGDTIEVEGGIRVRLICIDTPEKGEEYYQEAKDFLTDYILNEKIRLVKDVSETDRYGRLLRYVYGANVLINGRIVQKGYARVYRYPPDTELCDDIELLETQAKNDKIGIWSEPEPSPTPEPEPAEEPQPISGYTCSYNAYNCPDFSTHAQAQAVYEDCGGVSNDVHRLDRDKDGLACETLP